MVIALLVASAPRGATAAGAEVEEYAAKTALLYAFAKFVLWPEAAFADEDSPFIIAVVGDHPFAKAVTGLAAKRIQRRPIEIRLFETVSDFEPCHVLFCNVGALQQLAELNPQSLPDLHVLTVGEGERFATHGGVLALTFVEEHLGFVVNAAAARRHGLEVSSNVFNLAQAVIDEDD